MATSRLLAQDPDDPTLRALMPRWLIFAVTPNFWIPALIAVIAVASNVALSVRAG